MSVTIREGCGAVAGNWGALATVLAAFVAASVATFGYLTGNRSKRNENTATLFAAALDAVDEYKNLPYRIRRRTKSDPEVRAELGSRISDSQQKIRYYIGLLELEGPCVAQAYRELADSVWRKCKTHRESAWRSDPITEDGDMAFAESYNYRDGQARARCLIAMLDRLGRNSAAARRALLAPHATVGSSHAVGASPDHDT
jgi:hypothetical protein